MKTAIEIAGMVAEKFPKYGADIFEDTYIEKGEENNVFEDDASIHIVVNEVRSGVGYDQWTATQSYLDRVNKYAKKLVAENL